MKRPSPKVCSLSQSGTWLKPVLSYQALRVEAHLEENVNPQVMRLTTIAFCESVGQDLKMLENTPLSEKWQFPRFRGKGLPLPWIQQIIQLQRDIANNCLSSQVTCISHVPLEKRCSMSSAEIRNALPPKPGPFKRFRAAIRNDWPDLKTLLKDSNKISSLKMTFARTS